MKTVANLDTLLVFITREGQTGKVRVPFPVAEAAVQLHQSYLLTQAVSNKTLVAKLMFETDQGPQELPILSMDVSTIAVMYYEVSDEQQA